MKRRACYWCGGFLVRFGNGATGCRRQLCVDLELTSDFLWDAYSTRRPRVTKKMARWWVRGFEASIPGFRGPWNILDEEWKWLPPTNPEDL